jgi:hypothetical protein
MPDSWLKIMQSLSKISGIDSKIIEYVAVSDICRFCADGYSNKHIALILNVDLDYITTTLVKFLDTYGWLETLGSSPYIVYKKTNKNSNAFITILMQEDPLLDISTANAAYRVCKTYEKIEEKLNEYYQF